MSNAPAPQPRRSADPSLQVVSRRNTGGRPSPVGLLLVLLLIGVAVLVYHRFVGADDPRSPVVTDANGHAALSPERQAKLGRELDELERAVQYVLIATEDGYYPCFSCPLAPKTIFLRRGEVWRYGVTRKGEANRYPGADYGAPNLQFLVQFAGPYGECLRREKISIYNYPLLPEARRRPTVLLRPPGNKVDR